MTTPETIYLIPGEYEGENCLVWCDCAAPDSYCDPDEAVKYVRADTLPQPMLPPFPPFGEGMPRYGLSWNGPASLLSTPMDDGFWTPWHLASAENERLQARVAELYSALDNVNERLADGCQLSGDEIDDVDAALLNTGCEAFILRKQADAVEAFVDWVKPHWPTSIAIQIADDSRSYVFELRNEADKAEGADNAK